MIPLQKDVPKKNLAFSVRSFVNYWTFLQPYQLQLLINVQQLLNVVAQIVQLFYNLVV